MTSSKEIAGRRAADMVDSGMTVGLGTGSTVHFTLVRLAERIRAEGLDIRGVPTSIDTQNKANDMGIPLATLEEAESIDLTIDGADEVDPDFNLIKGGGGALLREKIIASISKREAIVVGRNKMVDRLGTTFLLPVEIIPFSRPVVARAIKKLGGDPMLRKTEAEEIYHTDNKNEILDCKFAEGIADARQLELDLDAIPGVVESGLFIDLCQIVVIGEDDGGCEVKEKS